MKIEAPDSISVDTTQEQLSPEVFERYVAQAEILLGAGKGHLGIINFLRSDGWEQQKAKELSYPIFDAAAETILRQQKVITIAGWSFIVFGGIAPFIPLMFGYPISYVSAATALLGWFLLGKVVRPARLPELEPME